MPRRLLLALLVLVFVAGCSGDPEPRVEQSPSATASVSPSASASPAAETAEEFIARWALVNSEMQNSGDAAAYRAITTSCRACVATATLVESYYKAGGYVRFDGLEVQSAVERPSSTRAKVFEVSVVEGATKYKTAASAKVKSFPGGPSTYRLTLDQVGNTWNLSDYVELAS